MHILHTFANNSSVPYLSWFAERARREGGVWYTFLILFPERPEMMDEMRDKGFTVIWIPFNDKKRKWGMIRALPLLWWHMLRIKPDIVHCNLFDDSLPGLIAAWFAGIRTRVLTRQDTGYHWMHARKWVLLDRWNARLATHVIAISNECMRYLIEKENIPASKVTMVHNGIPEDLFTNQDALVIKRLRERFGTHDRYPVIGTVARFIEWKGYRTIVASARSLVRQHPNAIFLFCGQGPQEAEVRQWVVDAQLQHHVVFTGWVERAEMPSFFGLLDIYLHAAEMEPFGLVYVEAMMNAVPVISTRTGAALDSIVDGTNGFLAHERTPQALARSIERSLASDLAIIGRAGRVTALAMFPFEVMWRGTMTLYRKALNDRK